MFDIRIGTIVPASSVNSLKTIKKMGFECCEITAENKPCVFDDIQRYAEAAMEALNGLPVTALGNYGNTLDDEKLLKNTKTLIRNAHLFGCDTVSLFAGAAPSRELSDTLKLFGRVFNDLCALAADNGVKLALENCGGYTASNIAYCPDMWERLFNEVPADNLGLEWEPAHQLCQLIEPLPQLRKWAKKVIHVHGKDATVAWDVIREHGIGAKVPFAWHRTPGYGDTNWADICTILMQNGYNGAIDIEGYHDPVFYDDLEWNCQKAALEYLKFCRGGAVYIDGPEYKGYQGRRIK